MRSLRSALACALAAAAIAPAAAAQIQATLFASGFTQPVFVTAPPGDTSRVFVVERTGRIKIRTGGSTLATPFLHLGSGGLGLITSGGSEQGLLGLAFHPNYASNGYFYVNYTNTSGHTVIARYTVSANPDLANTASGLIMLGPITQPQSNHNGGCIQFGGDGKLYIAMGDGGNFNDTGSGHATGGNAQSGATLLGKMLRIDVDIASPYVPADNPYFGAGDPLDEIWHMGLRNPFRFSFDSQTGDMYIGDVGQDAVEEVSFAAAGVSAVNFGWRCMEGNSCTGLSGCTCNGAGITLPIRDYNQGASHCSAIGGYVYRGCTISGLQGTYFYADYCSSSIWSFQYTVGGGVTNFTNRTTELEPAGTPTISTISSFGEDGRGELYICDYTDGEIYRIDPLGGFADCNSNGVADGCDIALGTSLDLNGNGIPDECDCQPAPFVYCLSKVNSLFCTPSIDFVGLPKVSGSQFDVTADQIISDKMGLLFYGFGSANSPFNGGTMCVAAPRYRTPTMNSGGTPGGGDCLGTFTFDMLDYILNGGDANLVVGQQVNCQYWSRDPQDPYTTNTTDAVEFVICN